MRHTGRTPETRAECRDTEEEGFDGNGVITMDDLLIVIGAFGLC